MIYPLWLFSSECYLQRPEEKSFALSFGLNVSHNHYVDDNHARFENKQKSVQVLQMLNKQDSSIQYTTEFENDNKQLDFLDITIANNGTTYDFKIFKRLAITNVQIKPNSNLAPNMSISVFKEF